jgi:hypothetical protein
MKPKTRDTAKRKPDNLFLSEIGEGMVVGFSAVGNYWQERKQRLLKKVGQYKMFAGVICRPGPMIIPSRKVPLAGKHNPQRYN